MVKERLAAHGIVRRRLSGHAPHLVQSQFEDAALHDPRVMTILLVITTTLVTAMGLAREREMGTLEQVLVTPSGRSSCWSAR